MALRAKHLAAIYRKLSPVIGDEETNALLSEFPTREDEEPITKHYLRAELTQLASELRGEMNAMRTELKEEIAGMRTWVVSVCIASVVAASTIVGTLT